MSGQAEAPTPTWKSRVQTPAPAPATSPCSAAQIGCSSGGKLPQSRGLAHICPALRPLTDTTTGVVQPRRRPACAPLDTRGPKQSSASSPPRAISRRSGRGRRQAARGSDALQRLRLRHAVVERGGGCGRELVRRPARRHLRAARGRLVSMRARTAGAACAAEPAHRLAVSAAVALPVVTDTASSPAGTSRQRVRRSSGHAALPRGAPGRPAPSGSSHPPGHKTSGGAPCDSALPCSPTLLRKARPLGGSGGSGTGGALDCTPSHTLH